MMKLNQILLIVLIVVITSTFLMKMKKPNVVNKVYVEKQHPHYPLVSYDIREMLPPSRRTYMRYPYYATKYGMFMR